MPMPTAQPNVLISSESGSFSVRFWSLTLLTGIGAGFAGGALMLLLHFVQHLAWSYQQGEFLRGVRATHWEKRVVILAFAGLLVGVARKLLKYTTGGHAGELSASIWFDSGKIPFLRTLARAVLSIILVGLGEALGREGAPKQAAAVIASQLCHWGKLTPSQRRILVACGAGAGMAAVYNVPLGGALFALEVLLGTVSLPLVLPALACSGIATAVSWLILSTKATYQVPGYPITAALVLWSFIAGPVGALLSTLYVRAVGWADRRKPSGSRTFLVPILIFILLGGASIAYPEVLGNGKDVVQATFIDQLALGTAGALFLLRPLATVLCLGSGAPGGLFTPTMTYGAIFGLLLGHAWTWALHLSSTAVGPYAIIGSGAILAASTEGPVSAVILLLELTRHIDALMVPLMISAVGATAVGRLLDVRSVYSARVRLGKGAAVAEAEPPAERQGEPRVGEGRKISSAARYSVAVQRLVELPAGKGLTVVNEAGARVGELRLEDVTHPNAALYPLELVTAGDLARSNCR